MKEVPNQVQQPVSSAQGVEWACDVCTFVHCGVKGAFLSCEICGSKKGEFSQAMSEQKPAQLFSVRKRRANERTVTSGRLNFNPTTVIRAGCSCAVLLLYPAHCTLLISDVWCGQESLEEFVSDIKPSQIHDPSIAWITASNPLQRTLADRFNSVEYQSHLDRITNVLEQQHANTPGKRAVVTSALKSQVVDSILEVATRQQCIVGKIMLFATTEQVDATWRTIATKTVAGQLGCSAKV